MPLFPGLELDLVVFQCFKTGNYFLANRLVILGQKDGKKKTDTAIGLLCINVLLLPDQEGKSFLHLSHFACGR